VSWRPDQGSCALLAWAVRYPDERTHQSSRGGTNGPVPAN